MPDSLIAFRFTNTYGETHEYAVADSRVYSYDQSRYLEGYCGWKKYTFRADGIESDIFLLDHRRWVRCQDYLDTHYVGEGSKYDLPDEIPHGGDVSYWDDIPHSGLPVEVNLRFECGGPPLDMHVERLTRFREMEGLCRQCGWKLRILLSWITRCTDTETGELVTDIRGYLLNRHREAYLRTSQGQRELAYAALDEGVKRLGDILPLLCYVGRASGQLRKPKREMLRAVVRKMAEHEGIDDAMIDSEINNRVPRLSESEARATVDRIAGDPQQLQAVHTIAKGMVATGKTPTPAEEAILAYIAGKL